MKKYLLVLVSLCCALLPTAYRKTDVYTKV